MKKKLLLVFVLCASASLVLGCGNKVKREGDAEEDTPTDNEDVSDLTEGTDTPTECTTDDECDDGDDCNGIETCGDDGFCDAGTPLDDGDPCEVDGADGECADGLCVPLTCGDSVLDTGEECDDGNDVADDGCEDTCRFSCHSGTDCDDENVCTDDDCAEGGTGRICGFTNNTDSCDDGDECTDPDVCADGECTPGPGICGCETTEDCAEFENGNLCDGTLVCNTETGLCEVDPETIVTCPSSTTVCTTYACEPTTGDCPASYATLGTACETDSDACTDDECDAVGACLHPATSCDDTNPCTTDTCDTTTGCVHTTVPDCCISDLDCDDTNPCTTDTCGTGNVCEHAAVDCSDTDLCTADTCDPTSGCVHATISCDDSNDCTTDYCYPDAGCVYGFATPGTTCDDGDGCTGPDTCGTGGVCSGPMLSGPRWYHDSDGDGYGDPGDRVCSTTPPTGYVSNDDDCCDSEADVHPYQSTYFCASFTCAGSTTPSWDYNCGGAEIQRWTNLGGCTLYGGYCDADIGWQGTSAPACGVTATYITGCGSGCTPTTESRCQECR